MTAAILLLACAPPGHHGDNGNGGQGGGGSGGNGGGGSGGSGGGGSGGSGGGPGGGTAWCDPGDLCATPECAASEGKRSVEGCLFYGLDLDNSSVDDPMVFGYPIGNPGKTPAHLKVERATGKDTWKMVLSGVIPPGQISYLRIATGPSRGDDYHIEGTGKEFRSQRIMSDLPVVAYQINSDDEGGASANSGSTLLLPVNVLGNHYYAIAPPERGVALGDRAFISVVGARNDTKVTLAVRGATGAGGSVPALAAGGTTDVVIQEGEVIQVETAGKGNDLTGSEITSDKPVTVYAGNVCGGFDKMRTIDCDHIEEVMYPTTTWGKSFVVLDLRMPLHLPSQSIWVRVVGSEDSTTLTFDAPRSLSGLPSAPVVLAKKGDFTHIEIKDPMMAFGSGQRAHFKLDADKPVQVESFMGTQEGAAIVVPVDQFLDDYLFSAHPWFTGYLLVTRPKGTPVTLDGSPMADSLFIDGGGGFEVSFVGMKRCESDPTMCGHRVEGAKVGVTMTANGGVCNYCYAGGAGARCVNRTAGCR